MVNLRNRAQLQPPARLQGGRQPQVPPAPARDGRAGGGRATAGRGAPPQGVQPAPVNHYHDMLRRIGLSAAAITALENLGLDNIQAFHDVTEKDIPAMLKEVCRGNILVRQTSQNYLHALRYWVMRQERFQLNYVPEDFTEELMRESLERYQRSQETPSKDLNKPHEMFKEKVKWRDFCDSFTTFMQRTKGNVDFPLSYI
jgi:hypothetical protein